MPIITLITDWNKNDYYIGALKGKILEKCNDANIVDISHNITSFNSAQAAFVLKNSFRNFPKNTIHIVGVNCEETEDSPFVIIHTDEHYFIGPDNGMFGLVFKEKPDSIVRINSTKYNIDSFPELTILADIASQIATGEDYDQFGEKKEDINRQIPLRPTLDPGVIMGSVIYIDSYLNVITNISKELFEKERKERKFTIYVDSNHYTIERINQKYNETQMGELLALFNSSGLLEIAINKGQISTLLNLKINSHIRIKFFDNKNR